MDSRTEITGEKPNGWRYEIQYGPDGEANYAWVYCGKEMVATMKTHRAAEIVSALLDRASSPARSAEGMVTVKPLEKLPAAFEVHDTENGVYLTRSEEAAIRSGYEYRGLYRRANTLSAQPGTEADDLASRVHELEKALRDAEAELRTASSRFSQLWRGGVWGLGDAVRTDAGAYEAQLAADAARAALTAKEA